MRLCISSLTQNNEARAKANPPRFDANTITKVRAEQKSRKPATQTIIKNNIIDNFCDVLPVAIGSCCCIQPAPCSQIQCAPRTQEISRYSWALLSLCFRTTRRAAARHRLSKHRPNRRAACSERAGKSKNARAAPCSPLALVCSLTALSASSSTALCQTALSPRIRSFSFSLVLV
jgi:hypothetical protein